jgi:DNA-directed RNA polymerase specialized sigma24 family protein
VSTLRGFEPNDARLVLNFAEISAAQKRRDSYESHRHRVFAVAFYMTGGELEAEDILANTFVRAFQQTDEPSAQQVDRSLVSELKQHVEFEPPPTTPPPVATGQGLGEQRNVKRPDLEAALIHLPATERLVFLLRDVEGYPVDRVAATLELTPQAVNIALLRARLKLREVLAQAPIRSESDEPEDAPQQKAV